MATRTITNSAEELLPQNRLRKSFVVQNEDTSINVFIKRESGQALTVSTTDHDFLLEAGSSLALNSLVDGEEAIRDRFTIIAASGTPRIAFFETEDIRR